MIKLGHVADIDNFAVPDCIKSDVLSILTILDECYGANRDINSDMGTTRKKLCKQYKNEPPG